VFVGYILHYSFYSAVKAASVMNKIRSFVRSFYGPPAVCLLKISIF